MCDMLAVVDMKCYGVGDYMATGGCVKKKVMMLPGLVMLYLQG